VPAKRPIKGWSKAKKQDLIKGSLSNGGLPREFTLWDDFILSHRGFFPLTFKVFSAILCRKRKPHPGAENFSESSVCHPERSPEQRRRAKRSGVEGSQPQGTKLFTVLYRLYDYRLASLF